jgi:hypothetical protein
VIPTKLLERTQIRNKWFNNTGLSRAQSEGWWKTADLCG